VSFGQTRNKCLRYQMSSKICAPKKLDQSSPKSLKTRYEPIPLALPNLVVLRQKCLRYHRGKFLLPAKVGQSSPNCGSKCRLARTLTMPNFIALRQKVCEVSAVETCSRKWSKVHQNTPYHAKFHRARSNDVREKSYIVTPFSILEL